MILRWAFVLCWLACAGDDSGDDSGDGSSEGEGEGDREGEGESRGGGGRQGEESESEAEGEPTECVPGARACDGDDVIRCRPDGTWGGPEDTCIVKEGRRCLAGECRGACEVAAETASYLGCEFWPTVTAHSVLSSAGATDDFDFAVAVVNPQPLAVQVWVDRGGWEIASTTVEAGDVATIVLPWIGDLRQNDADGYGFQAEETVLVRGGAYQLATSLPVAAYQFNPLQYRVGAGLSQVNSYSNDASLLLPTHSLTGEYRVVSRPTFSVDGGGSPGFFTVAAVQDGTEVVVTFSAHSQPGAGAGADPGHAPGDTAVFALDAGDALQVFSARSFEPAECGDVGGFEVCVGGRDYDLTGTRVVATAPVAVFAGHACAFVPFDRQACDHLEEQMLPLSAWGASVIAASTQPLVAGEPNVFKVVSGQNGNTIHFDPDVHPDVMLDAGEHVEFEHAGGFHVQGSGRLAVAQFMVGEDYFGQRSPPEHGDPSMALVAPTEQLRASYDFVTPDGYTGSHVSVIAPAGGAILLDGAPLPAFRPIGASGFGFARADVVPGGHRIQGDVAFGVMVSGVAPYASYLYSAGLELAPLDR